MIHLIPDASQGQNYHHLHRTDQHDRPNASLRLVTSYRSYSKHRYLNAAERMFGEDGVAITQLLLVHGTCNSHVLAGDSTTAADCFNVMVTSNYVTLISDDANKTVADLIFKFEADKIAASATILTKSRDK